MSITEIAIKRPLLISVIFVTLIIFGFFGYSLLSYNLLPKFEAPIISIQTIIKPEDKLIYLEESDYKIRKTKK